MRQTYRTREARAFKTKVHTKWQPNCIHAGGGAWLVAKDQSRRIARSILVYIAANPSSKDALKGMRWWIERGDECSDTDIEDAVLILLKRGLLACWEVTRMARLQTPSRLALNKPSVVIGLSPEFLAHPEQALQDFDSLERSKR